MEMSFIYISLMCAIVGYIIPIILTSNGMILEPVETWLNKFNLPDWIMKPLIRCSYCIAGQWALWTYLILCNEYSFFEHIFCIATSIFIVDILIKKLA